MGKNKDRELVQQYVSKRLFNGHIEFLHVEDGIENRLMRHLEFGNAKLSRFGIATKYPGHEGKDLLRIEISPYIVKHGDTITEWPCNPSNPYRERNTPVTRREERSEERINGYELRDMEGNVISKVTEGKFTMHVNTIGMEGSTFTIDLSDSELDFLYQGQLIPNDKLENIPVTGSVTILELEAIKQKQQ